MRFAPRYVLLGLAMVCVGLPARRATAKPAFVGEMASHLGLSYQPPCRVCHIHGTTGAGTVQTPFGMSMLGHGLTQNKDTLGPALDGLDGDKTDSDGDGVADIDELRADKDPNTSSDVSLVAGGPDYGCTVGPDGSRRHEGGQALFALLGIALMGWLVISRRSRPM